MKRGAASFSTGLRVEYTWDAENRLVQVEPTPGTTLAEGAERVSFAYDHVGRRVWKQVETYTAGVWNVTQRRKFVWQDWLMLAELEGGMGVPPVDTVVRQYTWGLDLAGLGGQTSGLSALEGAGGIGGLLAVHQAAVGVPAGDYAYCYDALGNVGQVVDFAAADPNAALVARYEYDPYGNVVGPDTNGDGSFDSLDNPGPYAAENPIRVSTKYWDDETGLGYWGYRYYSAALGRWLSRDPMEENAGTNLLAFVRNTPVYSVDPHGLDLLSESMLYIKHCMPEHLKYCFSEECFDECVLDICTPTYLACVTAADTSLAGAQAAIAAWLTARLALCGDSGVCKTAARTWANANYGLNRADWLKDTVLCEAENAVCAAGCKIGCGQEVDAELPCPPGMTDHGMVN